MTLTLIWFLIWFWNVNANAIGNEAWEVASVWNGTAIIFLEGIVFSEVIVFLEVTVF